MSEKRFEHSKANLMQSYISTFTDYRIYDNDLEDAYFVKCDEHCAKCLVDLLNSLYDENEQLRQQLANYELAKRNLIKRLDDMEKEDFERFFK